MAWPSPYGLPKLTTSPAWQGAVVELLCLKQLPTRRSAGALCPNDSSRYTGVLTRTRAIWVGVRVRGRVRVSLTLAYYAICSRAQHMQAAILQRLQTDVLRVHLHTSPPSCPSTRSRRLPMEVPAAAIMCGPHMTKLHGHPACASNAGLLSSSTTCCSAQAT